MLSQTKEQLAVKIVFGLGNPGEEYASTYHNTGRLFVERLSGESGAFSGPTKKSFEFTEKNGYILAISTIFMNDSGRAVSEALRFFKLKKKDLLLVHDDSDLKIGSYRLSKNSSSAGHRGVQSVIDHLKSQDFLRLRIGIRPSLSAGRASEFVLKNISAANRKKMETAFAEAEKEIFGNNA